MTKNILRSLLAVAALSAGWLGVSGMPLLFALVPLLLTSRGLGPSRRDWWRMAGWCALVFGLWSALTTWWIWYAAPIGAILSVVITVLLCGGSFMFYHYVSKRAKPSLAWTVLVCSWIAAEYWYTVGEVSFPWLMLGNGFARDVWAVQWYEYTGIFGGTLWVLLCNILIFRFVCSRTVWRGAAVGAVVAATLLLSAVLWGVRGGREPAREAEFTVVQPNIDPYEEKFTLPQEAQTEILLSLAGEAPRSADYIVLPETAIHDDVLEEEYMRYRSVAALHGAVEERGGRSQMIAGVTTLRFYPDLRMRSATARQGRSGGLWYDVYNSALAISPGERIEVHHKSKLVVGVEKMPYPRLMKMLDFLIIDLGGTTGQLGVDAERKVFTHPSSGVRLGTAICYESVYGAYFAEFVRRGAQVMAVITNDGWWGDTPGYRQHFSFARLRAVETRRAIARSANTGISGFIDPRGRVIESLGWDRRGTLTASLPLAEGETFYVRHGDWVARTALYVLILSVLYFIAYRTRRKDHLVE